LPGRYSTKLLHGVAEMQVCRQHACFMHDVQSNVVACIGILPGTSITLHASVIQVDEMEKAVDVAEKNMNRFGLTTQEIRSRRSWVHDTRRTVSQDKHSRGFGLEVLEMCHVVSCMTSSPLMGQQH